MSAKFRSIFLSASALTAVCLLAAFAPASQEPTIISADATHPGPEIASTMFGIFFEDINFGADGGLYPELVKNRSFEFNDPLTGWRKIEPVGATEGELDIRTEGALNEDNPHYLRLRVYRPGFGVTNSGFRGMGVNEGAEYTFSAYVRTPEGGPHNVRAELMDENDKPIGTSTLSGFAPEWKKYEAVLRATATTLHAHLNVLVDDKGYADLDMVSLYPKDTWNNRPNGLRKDLVQLLADMHPGFMRFPGGCIVEGRRLVNRYQWKKTIGDVAARRTIINRWSNEFDHRPTPDYYQSFGLGFYEFFQLAEDIGASPLPILNCGMACQFNSSESAPLEQTNEYIQDALDLIDFANGPVSDPWGKLRAQMGHPAPFHLKMIGVGNEQWGPRYLDRYKLFAAALKSKHPEIELITSAGPSPSGEEFDYLWSNLRKLKADIVDEHYYMAPGWFLANSNRYDRYDRSGPKVFAGEYAAQTSAAARPDNRNNWNAAIAEAAFMTGLERNADVVRMASYAPLFAHVDAWQWTPDLIWFDNLRSFGTPNYYVQKLFANNVGTRIVPVTPANREGLYTAASIDDRAHELVVTAVNFSSSPRPVQIDLKGASNGKEARTILISSADLQAENSLDDPKHVAPVETTTAVENGSLSPTLAPYSVSVFRTGLR